MKPLCQSYFTSVEVKPLFDLFRLGSVNCYDLFEEYFPLCKIKLEGFENLVKLGKTF